MKELERMQMRQDFQSLTEAVREYLQNHYIGEDRIDGRDPEEEMMIGALAEPAVSFDAAPLLYSEQADLESADDADLDLDAMPEYDAWDDHEDMAEASKASAMPLSSFGSHAKAMPQAAPSPLLQSMELRDEIRFEPEESFQEKLLSLIDEKGLLDTDVYKKANLSRKLFSKIRSNKDYQPAKKTALALAISLELDLAEAEDLLRRAGYALSPSSKFDLIVRYFIENGNYDIYTLNAMLYQYDQPLLGM